MVRRHKAPFDPLVIVVVILGVITAAAYWFVFGR